VTKTFIGGIAAAVLFCGVMCVLAAADTAGMAGTSRPSVKGDRLDIRVFGIAWCQSAWPYYDSACLRYGDRPGGRTREVRVVSADRLPSLQPAVNATN
jgi:hypothetical protein